MNSALPPPFIIPLFIPHQGCPHRCIFCNQHPLTGTLDESTASPPLQSVESEINLWLARSSRKGRKVQVAFYGGSFTGLPVDRQRELLSAVQPFIRRGLVDGIRLSTRPDYITQDTPAFLHSFKVKTVELGVQSMDQNVLDRSLRGHNVQQTASAITLLKKAGLNTGAQLMIGLPGETSFRALSGAKQLALLQPDFARLYPALVIKGSGLATLYHKGQYRPLSLPKAIALAARVTTILAQHGIPVIRTGLQPSVELEANMLAGPYHPAFGELVKSSLFFNSIRKQLCRYRQRPCRLIVCKQDRSLFNGQKRCNINRLEKLHLLDQVSVVFTDTASQRGTVRIEPSIGDVAATYPVALT